MQVADILLICSTFTSMAEKLPSIAFLCRIARVWSLNVVSISFKIRWLTMSVYLKCRETENYRDVMEIDGNDSLTNHLNYLIEYCSTI